MAIIRITVKLTPLGRKDEIKGWDRDADGNPVLRASVTAAPDKNKANDALTLLLAKEWRLPKSSIRIIRGGTSRTKTVEINHPDAEKIIQNQTNK